MIREEFLKIYANIPINLRQEIILKLDNKEPITWNVAYLEINQDTKLGKEILKKIDLIWGKTKRNFKKESLYLNNKIIADVYYKKNDTTITPYLKQFLKQYKRLIVFFNVQPPRIHICFVYTRKEMDKHWGRKSKITAMVDNKNPYLIYIFSPLVFEKLTTSKKREILPIIIHETAHTFVTQINKRCFAWANEGICQYVEGKNVHNNIVAKENWKWFKENKILIDPIISWRIVMKHEGYKIAYLLVKYIIKLHSKQAIIDILSIRRTNRDKQIEQKISKILESDIDIFLKTFEKKLKLV